MKNVAGHWAAGEGRAPVQEAAPYPVSPSNLILLKCRGIMDQLPGSQGLRSKEGTAKTFSPGAQRLFGEHLKNWQPDTRRQAASGGEDLKGCSVLHYTDFWAE